MDSTQLTLLALGLGTIIGGSVVAVIFLALGARNRAHAQASMAIPDGVREVLGGMDDAAVVVAPSFLIVAASAPAAGFGMQQGGTLTGDSLRALVRAARSTDRAESETLRLQREVAPATPRLVVARASVISPRLTLVVVRDITERERVEEMRRDFVSNTSHELKTPVGAITLLAEAVESAADDPDQVRKFAARLSAEAGRLGNLTSRIMSLSRLQASVEVTNDRDVAIDEIVTSAIESHAVEAESAWITIVRGGERGLYVRGDVQVLSDAVGNLIANAIAYSPAGGEVGVGVKEVGGVVEIAVTDRGIGIPEDEQQRVFERFYRADQARSRRTGGTGLGLAIVKHAVQRHGGQVVLWSRPGKGSTFTIRLPAIPAPEGLGVDRKKAKKKRKKNSVRPSAARADKEIQ